MMKDFLKLFGNILIMLGIMMASFLLLINLYHYREVSHTYNIDTNENVSYKNIKDNISNAERLLSLDISKVSAGKSDAARAVKISINKCIDAYKDANLYKNSGIHSFKYYDTYVNMNYLYTNINSECNSLLKYNTKPYIDSNPNIKSSFDAMITNYDKVFNVVISNSNYMEKKSLNTNSYSFTSEMNRFSIFDDLRSDTDFTLKNYDLVSSLILDLCTWYSDAFGGGSNE